MDIIRPDALPAAIAIAVALERLWEYFAKPFTARAPDYIAQTINRYGPAVIALAICAASRLTLTTDAIHPVAGTAITGLIIGGGSNLIHDITQRQR